MATEWFDQRRKPLRQDRSHNPWGEANRRAQCEKSACCVRRGGVWKRGMAGPPRSRRTVRDTLASYGSHCSAASKEHGPMSEQAGLAARDALQPVDGPRLVPVQGLELPIGPSRQKDVDGP